jgi:uncharacterized protein DUF1931
MPVMNVAKFEKFFRLAGGLDVDKGDLKKYNDFLDRKMYDLVKSGETHAMANGHGEMWPSDLPITKGLEEDIREFETLEEGMGLEPTFEKLVKEPLLDVGYSKETQAQLPRIAGGTEPRAGAQLPHHRARSEESQLRALGARVQDVRPARVTQWALSSSRAALWLCLYISRLYSTA